MHIAYISVGSNLGNRESLIKNAIDLLNNMEKIEITKISTIITTKPVGGPPQPDFLNGVFEINTTLFPEDLLNILQKIEFDLGRERLVEWGPRTIDLDILFYDDNIINMENLVIPHPLLHLRWFVLKPLSEIAPNFRHPLLGKTVLEIYSERS